jgi:fibronectin type 3 domain-containing protein
MTARPAARGLALLVAAAGLVAGCSSAAGPAAPAATTRAPAAWPPRGAERAAREQPARAPASAVAHAAPAPAARVWNGGPARPTRLVAASGEPREVPLRWQPVVVGGVAFYRVLRRDAGGGHEPGPYVEVGRTADATTATYLDRGGAPAGRPGRLADGHTYEYVVTAVAADGSEARSEPASATTAPPPAPPDGLDRQPPRAGGVLLTWEPSADHTVAGYRVYRSAFAAGPFDVVGEVRGRFSTAFVDSARRLLRLRTYQYRVASVSSAGAEGPASAPVTAWLKPPPLPPLDVAAAGGLARRVRVSWSPGHESDLRAVVWRAGAGGRWARVAAVEASRGEHVDTGLGDGATFTYRLTVVDTDGLESQPSAIAMATTRPRPPSPREVSAERNPAGVTVRWQAVAGAVRYRLLRVNAFGRHQAVAEVTGISAQDRGEPGRYAVVAIDPEGLESRPSAPVALQAVQQPAP